MQNKGISTLIAMVLLVLLIVVGVSSNEALFYYNSPSYTYNNDNYYQNITDSSPFWVHIIRTYEIINGIGTFRIYTDGDNTYTSGVDPHYTERGANPHSILPSNTQNIRLGGRNYNNNLDITGKIDDLTFFSRALTPEEALELFERQRKP